MTAELSRKTIDIVKATVPALEAHGLAITQAMYERLFRDEEIRDLFNQSHHGDSGSQPKALAGAIIAYARNIESLGVLGPAVERIAQKHVGLQILPEHYPYVGKALLGAIGDVLGEAATPEVLEAWGEAYGFLAEVLIARERAIYTAIEESPGGWTGWRDFRIVEKTPESAVITSFVLAPVDGGPVLAHRPGQYLTFVVEAPGQSPLRRNYSISSAPDGATYRISVKREPRGIVSGWLHDRAEPGTVLKVAPPAGEFFLRDRPSRPVLLLSGGVGLTPMIAMLETMLGRASAPPVHYVHGTHDGATHAMRERVRDLADRTGARATIFYERPRSQDEAGRDYDHEGLITVDWLAANTPLATAEIYLCGPKPFLRTFVNGLAQAGVASERIHYEFFGPADELLAA